MRKHVAITQVVSRTYPRGVAILVEAGLSLGKLMSPEEAVTPLSGTAVDRSATADAGPGSDSPVQARLEDQIAWYDAKSQQNQLWFKLLKICQIVIAAAIPVAVSQEHAAWVSHREESSKPMGGEG